MFRTTITVNYGTLDLLNLQSACPYVIQPTIQTCTKTNLDLSGYLARLNFIIYKNQAIPRRDLVLYGDFEQTLVALSNVTYLANQYENSRRLTLSYYNPTTALVRPYELLKITVEFAPGATCFIDATTDWWAKCQFVQLASITQVSAVRGGGSRIRWQKILCAQQPTAKRARERAVYVWALGRVGTRGGGVGGGNVASWSTSRQSTTRPTSPRAPTPRRARAGPARPTTLAFSASTTRSRTPRRC